MTYVFAPCALLPLCCVRHFKDDNWRSGKLKETAVGSQNIRTRNMDIYRTKRSETLVRWYDRWNQMKKGVGPTIWYHLLSCEYKCDMARLSMNDLESIIINLSLIITRTIVSTVMAIPRVLAGSTPIFMKSWIRYHPFIFPFRSILFPSCYSRTRDLYLI